MNAVNCMLSTEPLLQVCAHVREDIVQLQEKETLCCLALMHGCVVRRASLT